MSSPGFHALPPAKPDPIFAIAGAAKAAGPRAINGTIGVYMDEEGRTALFPSVKAALEDVTRTLTQRSYSYPALLGLPEYRQSVTKLIFGDKAPMTASIASTGGTGAVALNLRLARLMDPEMPLILPMPAWANHPPLCRAAGFTVREVPCLQNGKPTVADIAVTLKKEKRPCTVLLQVGCHNPAGLDFSDTQWMELRDLMEQYGSVAILDLAYQGFKDVPENDAAPVRMMAASGVPTLIAWSASKNHSLYSERTGMALAVVKNEAEKAQVEGHYSTITRGIHSAAATFGQSVVAAVQMAHKDAWLADMQAARTMLARKRQALFQALPEDMRASVTGHGMFAMLPLSATEIDRLKVDHLVFLTGDGRINIAGIPLARIPELGEKILKARD